MAIQIPRGTSDEVIDQIIDVLRRYEADHPQAQVDLYRQNLVSVRLRIIDPDFAGELKSQRHRLVWQYLESLPEEVQSDISTLLVLTPEELPRSFGNFEFEDPVPSEL